MTVRNFGRGFVLPVDAKDGSFGELIMTTLHTRFGEGIQLERGLDFQESEQQQDQPRRINVGENERAVSVAAGAILALQGLSRGSLVGLLTAGVGGMFIYRGISGHCGLYEKMGIDTAHDGRTAMQKLASGNYSVLVLDLMVPELNGFEIIEMIKEENMNVPVAVVSAVSQQALTRLDLDVVKLVISKPFDVDEFTKAILALCAEAEGNA